MLIDTHAHLWWESYKDDLNQVLERAKAAGVEKMIVPGTDIESSGKAVALARKYPGVIYASVGVHPEEVFKHESDVWKTLLKTDILAAREQVIAIGEIGTDASTKELKSCMSQQKELFREQCLLALESDFPVIIHTRNSLTEALEVLDELPSMPRGQFHCFSHDEMGVKEVLSRGFYVSFCANITWSKRVAKLVSLIPDNRLILETDSPFMDPGNRNEPANVVKLVGTIAELRGQNVEQIAGVTTTNAIRLFRL